MLVSPLPQHLGKSMSSLYELLCRHCTSSPIWFVGLVLLSQFHVLSAC